MNSELDPKDKALLQDIAAFNQEFADKGWHVQDKIISENLSGIRLANSSLTSVRLLNVRLVSSVIRDSQFKSVEFVQTDFSGAALTGVQFLDCDFVAASFARAVFSNCRFTNCRTDELNAREATFDHCIFESLTDRAGVFSEATIKDCRFEKCGLENSSFYSTRIVSVLFKNSTLNGAIFSEIRGTDLEFEGSSVDKCAFSESEYGTLVFEGCKSKGTTFRDFRAENVRILNCLMLEGLSVMECSWGKTTLARCPTVSQLTFRKANLKDLSIAGSQFAYFSLRESEVLGESSISECQLAGVNFEKSNLRGLKMTRCTLEGYLILNGAVFDGLVLSEINYGKGIELKASEVKYLNTSARFRAQ